MGLFNKDEDLDYVRTNNDNDSISTDNVLVVEIVLPTGQVEKREFHAKDFYVEEDEKVLYVCEDDKKDNAIAAFNMRYVLSFMKKDGLMSI